MPPAADSVVRRADVLWRHATDSVLVRRLGAGEVDELRGPSAALWDVLLVPLSFADLCVDLALDHHGDPATVEAEIGPVIDDLAARGMIVVD